MRKISLLGLIMLLSAALVWMAGCGSKSTEPSFVNGDTTAAEFQIMKELIGNGMLEQDQYLIDLSLGLMEQANGSVGKRAYKPVVDSNYFIQIITYDTSNYWHIFGYTASLNQDYDTLYFEGHDSLRFSNAQGYMAIPDSTVTGINIRAHRQFEIAFSEGSISVRNHANVDLTGIYEVEFTLNGFSSDSTTIHFFQSDTAFCDLDAAINQDFNNLYFDSVALNEDACPASGAINADASLSLACVGGGDMADSLNIDGAWSLDVEFHNRTLNATFVHGNVIWHVIEDCGPDQGTAKSRWESAFKQARDLKD